LTTKFGAALRYDFKLIRKEMTMIWWLVNLILLILLGVLGIASWLKTQQPKLAPQLSKLEAVEGWVGLVGLVWGLIMLLQWLQFSRYMSYAPVYGLISLLTVLTVLALSLILGLPQLRTLIGSNGFTNKLAEVTGKMAPFKMILGAACLFFALYSLVMSSGVRTF
jgi:hypothetical protein